MSFAEQLGQTSFAATKACHDQWVEETLQTLRTRCQNAAERGGCASETRVYRPRLGEDVALVTLRQKVADLGFHKVVVDIVGNRGHKSEMLVRIRVEWHMGSASGVPDDANIAPQGIKGTCPICQENRHMVALTPCGHTVCKQCYGSCQLRECPMCRQTLTGATRALFMG
eukprot:Skav234899  [mRNA]  locus=scaffold840:689777:690286:+ [translate_table: standard]